MFRRGGAVDFPGASHPGTTRVDFKEVQSHEEDATLLMVLAIVSAAGTALAGAKLQVNDDAYIDLGYRLQTYFTNHNADIDPAANAGWGTMRDFSVRRARFRMKGVINDKISMFLQTDVATQDMKMIDAFVTYKADPWLQFYMGRNMAPSSRQATTTSGALMAMDRPGLTYKSLNWGTRYKYGFNANTYMASGISAGPDAVRDNGLTVFGSGDVGEQGHLKYYAGMYNGANTTGIAGNDKDHFAFRAQYNLWDAEGGYYNSSTYLGKKKTLGIGVSYDMQDEVAAYMDNGNVMPTKYALLSADIFLELPNSAGDALTVEGGYNKLDLDDNPAMMSSQGKGFYGQAGYYLASGFQPWFMFESFSSDAAADGNGNTPGDFTTFRAGVTYYFEGQHANIKLGLESFKPDVPFTLANGSSEDTYTSVTLGFFTTY